MASAALMAQPIARQIEISTEIDKNKFISGEFLDVHFMPDILTAVFDKKSNTFSPLSTHMSVITNLQVSEANNGFTVSLSENIITCADGDGQEVNLVGTPDAEIYGFAKLHIDGQPIPLGGSVSISEFNVVRDGMLEGYYPANITFAALSESRLNQGHCSGNMSVRLEFNI